VILRLEYILLSIGVFAADQLSKLFFAGLVDHGGSVKLLWGAASIVHVRNTGAAFGLFPGMTIPLAAISIVVIFAIIFMDLKFPLNDKFTQLGLSLILGGSAGNLLDRLFKGYVHDFISFPFWPAFNIADIAVNAGIALLLYAIFFTKEWN
jgi:signal peptidase II